MTPALLVYALHAENTFQRRKYFCPKCHFLTIFSTNDNTEFYNCDDIIDDAIRNTCNATNNNVITLNQIFTFTFAMSTSIYFKT